MDLSAYELKIKQILNNRLQYNGDHDVAINAVKTWLCCEWQCGMIPDTADYLLLLDRADTIAKEMIAAL